MTYRAAATLVICGASLAACGGETLSAQQPLDGEVSLEIAETEADAAPADDGALQESLDDTAGAQRRRSLAACGKLINPRASAAAKVLVERAAQLQELVAQVHAENGSPIDPDGILVRHGDGPSFAPPRHAPAGDPHSPIDPGAVLRPRGTRSLPEAPPEDWADAALASTPGGTADAAERTDLPAAQVSATPRGAFDHWFLLDEAKRATAAAAQAQQVAEWTNSAALQAVAERLASYYAAQSRWLVQLARRL